MLWVTTTILNSNKELYKQNDGIASSQLKVQSNIKNNYNQSSDSSFFDSKND